VSEHFSIQATDVDAAAIVSQIKDAVQAKKDAGMYRDSRVARAEMHNLDNLRDEDSFLEFYLECLREAVFIDINDFEIRENRTGALAAPLILLKKTIWKLLKFYTYRMWTQQNQVNSLLQSAVESVDEHYRAKLEALEKRVAELESTQSHEG
jgi:hypothetical protein